MAEKNTKFKKKIKKRINKSRLIIILIIVFLITATLAQFLYFYLNGTKQKQVYDMKVQVADYVGFSTDTYEMNFGAVTPGGGSKKNLDISADEPTRVDIILEGELAPWVSVSENNFVFEGSKTIIFSLVVPEDAEYGGYSGKAIIIFKKA